MYKQKSHFLLAGSGTSAIYSLLNTKNFNKVFQYILKSLKAFLIRNYFYINAKNTNMRNKTETNFDLTTDSLIGKY